jgi:hypothetical protein
MRRNYNQNIGERAPVCLAEELQIRPSMFKPAQRRIEDINVVLIDEATIEEAEQWLSGCELCAPNAIVGLDYLLGALTGCDPTVTEYVMRRRAQCPFCLSEIGEKTFVLV